jgi:hypothetical protein
VEWGHIKQSHTFAGQFVKKGELIEFHKSFNADFPMSAGIVTAVPITSFSTDTRLLLLVWCLSSSKSIRELN